MSSPGPRRPIRSPRERERLRTAAAVGGLAAVASLITFVAITLSTHTPAADQPEGPPLTGQFTESAQQRPVAPGSGSPTTVATSSVSIPSISVPRKSAPASVTPPATTRRSTAAPTSTPPAPRVFRFPALADVHARSAPRLDAPIRKRNAYLQGAMVPIVCQLAGGEAYRSTVWNRTPDGLYISDAYVKTGSLSFSPKIPRC